MHELIATAAVLVLLLAYSQIYIFIAGLGGVVQAPLKSNTLLPSSLSPLLRLLVRSPTRNEELSASIRSLSFCSPSPLPPSHPLFSSSRSRFAFVFVSFTPSLSLSLSLSLRFTLTLSQSFSVLVRCFAAHGFSRAACNSSGDLLRLIELWETRDENARRTSERETWRSLREAQRGGRTWF